MQGATTSRSVGFEEGEAEGTKKRPFKGSKNIKQDKEKILTSIEKVQTYEESFAKILKATQIPEIEELVNTFVEAEDKNFSLFNYVNTLSAQIEK